MLKQIFTSALNVRLLPIAVSACSILALGCDGDLEQQYTVDRLRILGIVAEPPTVASGETTELTPIVARPPEDTTPLFYQWQICVFNGGTDTYYECPERVGDIPFENILATGTGESLTFTQDVLSDEELEGFCAALDAIASSPDLPPGLALPKCGSGLPVTVRVKICEQSEDCDNTAAEIATRTLVLVRDSFKDRPDRNVNPEIISLSVDGSQANPTSVIEVSVSKDKDQEIPLTLEIPRSSVQRYLPIRDPGEEEPEREEDLQVTWHASHGDFFKLRGYYYDGKATFEELQTNKISFDLSTVELPKDVKFWIVLRDNRGGFAWLERTVRFVDGR